MRREHTRVYGFKSGYFWRVTYIKYRAYSDPFILIKQVGTKSKLVVKTIFYSLAALVRKILFSPLEDKIHIFAPPCNILYIF